MTTLRTHLTRLARLIGAMTGAAGLLAPLTAAQDGMGHRPVPRVTTATHALAINEVAPGPQLSYIELYNRGQVALYLDGYTLETATGVFSLDSLAGPLSPDEHFVLFQGHASEVGVSTDPEVPCIITSVPTCGLVTDTVLLRSPSGRVIDAMSYGVNQDTSARYGEAVQARQFAPGAYVRVAGEFMELSLGRDRHGADRNRAADWMASGGRDALVGSPFAANDALPTGEEVWIPFFQAFLAGVVTQPYYDVTIEDADYSDFTGNDQDSSATHTMVFRGALLGAGDWTLSGTVTNHLAQLAGGAWSLESHGTLSEPLGRSIEFSIRREMSGDSDVIAVDATIVSPIGVAHNANARVLGPRVYPYSLTMDRRYSGERGSFTHHITRVLTGWSGLPKTTNGTQQVDWTLSQTGTLVSTDSSMTFTRPYPLSDGWVGNIGSTPDPVIATETVHMDMLTTMTPTGPTTDWTRYELHYDNGLESLIGTDFTSTVTAGMPLGSSVHSTIEGRLGSTSRNFPLHIESSLTAMPGGKLFHWTTTGTSAGVTLPGVDAMIDPPLLIARGFWSKLKSAVDVTARVIGTVAIYTVGAVGCVATTAAGAAAGGGVSVATLGTASLGGLAMAAGGVTACAGLLEGAEAVSDLIWEQ